ncbi:glycoside hydrolase family 11 protein [Ruminococcus sp.]|uniref:glycoside hydrolase family 11 protein n=1 Tax=Ruminococcus sp. TaxID=41978 RepID=UPI0025D96E4D|nr:glycoside hydrolase family 11 protein [Ruminococcus sp.]MBQ8966323.1 glycoside hydrolase family 11 protein [Ruminococcus sp.]
MGKRLFKRFAAGVVATACMTGLLAGCGGESGNSSSSAKTTKAESKAAEESEAAENHEDQVFTENVTGTEDGYAYELWKDNGDTEMTITGGGTFSCKWENINNALFRKGQKFDCTQTYKDLGNISIKYGVDYQPDGNSYMCVYGWTRDPLIEYYIVETWGSWRPPGAPEALGTVTVDGGTYDIYRTTRYDQPSIDGTQTFDQFWSVRQVKPEADGTKIEGTISVSKHFDAWEQIGLHLGNMHEVALNIEGYQSKGQATIYQNDLVIDGNYSADPAPEVTVNESTGSGPAAMAGGVGFFTSNFEEDECSWGPRGSATVSRTTDEASDGSGSLFVSGRTDNWNGAAINLDVEAFKPGGTYTFKTDAMQKSGEEISLKLTMQYSDGGGDHYDQVDLKTAPDGEWVTLEGEYTLPEGAVNPILYVESPDSLADFYIDCAEGKGDGGETEESSSGKKDEGEYVFEDPVAINNTADVSWIDKDKPMVAIAFDDGASATKKDDPAYRIIDTMADNGFHATFFYVGSWIKTEEQVKYAKEKGMEIANHTMTHPYLSKLEPAEIRDEYEQCREKLKGIIGEEPSALCRLPYLDGGGDTRKTLNDVALISCSIDTQDWNKASADEIVEKLKKAKEDGSLNGAIILCHENYATTAEAMETIVPWLKDEGWQVVTVSELFAANGKELMGGNVYSKLS